MNGNLVVTRYRGEKICIGNDVTVTVLDCNRGRARIAVSAPREVPVDREEIRQRKQRDMAVR